MDLDGLRAAIAAGDTDAFGRWVASAERPLRDSLRPFAAAVDTEAVLQESLLRVWQAAPRVEPDGRPNSLLRLGIRIARNLAVDETRRRRRDDLVDTPELERVLALAERVELHSGPDPHLRRLIEECRDKLPGKPAQALVARLTAGGSEPDRTLAQRLGMTLNTFLQNFTRARKLMAECLKDRGVDLDAELS